jgi:hypothetical protein
MYKPLIDRNALRREEIAQIDAISRTRALTEWEGHRLEQLLYRERYAEHRQHARRAA